MDLGRPLLEPAKEFLEVATHIELVVDSLELPSVLVDVSLEQVAKALSLLVEYVLEEVDCRFNFVEDVQEQF